MYIYIYIHTITKHIKIQSQIPKSRYQPPSVPPYIHVSNTCRSEPKIPTYLQDLPAYIHKEQKRGYSIKKVRGKREYNKCRRGQDDC